MATNDFDSELSTSRATSNASATPTSAGLTEIRRRNRRRLVGAITIAAVIAVALPLLFKAEERATRKELELAIPTQSAVAPLPSPAAAPTTEPTEPAASKGAGKAAAGAVAAALVAGAAVSSTNPAPAKTSPTPVPAAAPSAKVDTKAPAPATQTTQKTETKVDAKAAATSTAPTSTNVPTKPAVASAAPSAPTAAQPQLPAQAVAKLGGFAIQLASLKDKDSAKRLGARVSEQGLSFFFERIPTEQGELIRVRAGPFKTKQEAEKARGKLALAGISGSVVNMQ